MKAVKEAASCLVLLIRFSLLISGAYVIFSTGWDRLVADPLYALVAIIFYYLIFSPGGNITNEEQESNDGK